MPRFLRHFALALMAMLASIAAFTTLMDPYDYWNIPRIEGVNARRPAADTHLMWVKARQYPRVRPRTVVAGNSRVQVGFDPASPAWGPQAQPVYNYGLAGRTVPELVGELERAIAAHRPSTLHLGIDLIDFRIPAEKWAAYRPAPPPPAPTRADDLARLGPLTLSLTALGDSLKSLAAQRARDSADITPNGYNALAEYRRLVATEGHAALFEQRNRENYRNYRAGPKAVAWPTPGGSPSWSALARLAATARANNVTLILFTYPYHADILVSLHRAGLLPALLDQRARLAAFAATHGIAVHDFTVIDAATTEPVPTPGDRRARMRFYWEAGHFKATLGDRMIEAMRAPADGGGEAASPPATGDSARNGARSPMPPVPLIAVAPPPPGFGARLTPATVAAGNARLAAAIAALPARDPAQAARLAASFAAVGP